MAGSDPYPSTAIDPEIRTFIDAITGEAARHPAIDDLPRDQARQLLESIRAPWAAGGPRMATVQEEELIGTGGYTRIRIYRPATGTGNPALIYLHGGGWTWFSLDTHDRLMREYAARTGFAVIGVDYALAPEHRFPVALDQVIDVIVHLHSVSAGAYGIDPGHLAVGGDSAGANLALAAALALRDRGDEHRARALLLNYGAFTHAISAEAEQRFGGPEHMLPAAEMRAYWDNYVREPSDLDNPLVCPLNARLHDLPPSLLVVPECDVLAEQSLALSERLQQAGSPAEARVYPGATHSFLEAVSVARLSDRALAESAAWLSRKLS